MDQLVSVAAVEGTVLRIDCDSLDLDQVPFPEDAEIVVIALGSAPGAERRRPTPSAGPSARRPRPIGNGPLRDASPVDVEAIDDPVLRRRARHVTTENQRVDALASALATGQLAYAGELLVASHASLRDDFEVSTPTLDALVGTVRGVPGVYGARVTGAGFGGCVVALCKPKTRIAGPVVWRGRPRRPVGER